MGGNVRDREIDRENEKRIVHCVCSLWVDSRV